VVYLPWSKRWVNVTCWENAVTACQPCNSRKADRTPVQAGMALRFLPRMPTSLDAFRVNLARVRAPSEWVPFLPEDFTVAAEAPSAGDDIVEIVPLRR
jgi:hypothetical protein